jgi:NAD(P)-dependent dehydrogenase (short-subunit alcohol dehydrogenase family)
LNPPAILFAKAGANIIISARRPEKLSEVRQAAQQAHKEGGTGQGGKVFEWVQDVQDRRGVDSESPFSPYTVCGLAQADPGERTFSLFLRFSLLNDFLSP